MRLSNFWRGFGAISLSTGILAGQALAAPQMPTGMSIESTVVAPVNTTQVISSLNLRAVSELPGKIGSITYDSDGRCIALVLGGAANLSGAEVRALVFGNSKRKNFRSLANSHSLIMCPGANGETEVVLANQAGLKKLLTSRGPVRVNGSSIISTVWEGANKLATALIGRRVVLNGAKFISNDYDVHFGTDGGGKVYFIILDRVANKAVMFHQDHGGYHGELTADVVSFIQERLGQAIAQAPRIMLAD